MLHLCVVVKNGHKKTHYRHGASVLIRNGFVLFTAHSTADSL